MTDLSRLAQSLGGVKSQQGFLRERITELESQNADLGKRVAKLESRVNMIMLSQGIFYAILIIGSIVRWI